MESKRIVVKVGTSSLTYEDGRLKLDQIERLVRETSGLVNEGHQVIIITSGAIGAGMSRLGLTAPPKSIPDKQATAAVGQGLLMQVYSKLFAEYCHICAQVLLTAEDLEQRQRYLNCRNTFETLLSKNVIPIVNENDSVSIDEIKFGDNDMLSSLVANLVGADLLIILSDIDGVYDKNPKSESDAKLIPVIEEITNEIVNAAKGASGLGTGGMVTKINAARICVLSGIPMIIANGSVPGIIRQAVNGESIGTLFVPKKSFLPSRKRWLAFYNHPHGQLIIDQGAEMALQGGKSLLPVGVTKCTGNFNVGDLVTVCNQDGKTLAKGLVNYSAVEVNFIKGKISTEISKLLTDYPYEEIIHRDNLVMLSSLGGE